MGLMPSRSGIKRPDTRRVVVVVPSALTLGNLFFGFWAMVSAYNHNFIWAAWFIMFSGVLDMLDGRVARLSKTGSRFGAELDSLVDVTSFGVAPAMIMYFLEFGDAGKFGWLLCYFYVVAVAVRLARYNVSHGNDRPGWFTGLPSPAAGMTLAVYYPFSQTDWYQASVGYLNLQRQGLAILMVLLSLLMVSNVKYPRFPTIGFRTIKGLLGLLLHVVILVASLWVPRSFLFPLGITYLTYGVVRAIFFGFLDRGDWQPSVIQPDDEDPGARGPRLTAPRRGVDDR
jgi:CDP-diacylglycerol--serine O-phosphatidyltransferase